MKKAIRTIGFTGALLVVGLAWAQHPLVDEAASRVIQKYQQSSCEQLWVQRGEAKPPREQELIQILRDDPQVRREFLDRVAAPIANKMFECGLIP